jgi:hypothetical protein
MKLIDRVNIAAEWNAGKRRFHSTSHLCRVKAFLPGAPKQYPLTEAERAPLIQIVEGFTRRRTATGYCTDQFVVKNKAL